MQFYSALAKTGTTVLINMLHQKISAVMWRDL